ncbi:MAG: hypothetical protein ACM3US_06275 [Sphingomonadaceae bacterium]
MRSARVTTLEGLTYCVHGLRIEAWANHPHLAEAMDGLFHRYAEAAPGAPKRETLNCQMEVVESLPLIVPPDATVVNEQGGLRHSALDGRLFLEARGLSLSVADFHARRMAVYVVRERAGALWSIQHFAILPMVLEFLRLRGLYPIHGAALESNGHALILPALPGSGKSTLSIALLRAGLRLLSDDMPLLTKREGGVQVLAFPEDINVCADGLGFFRELAFLAGHAPNERNKYSFPADALFPGCLAEQARPRLLVFPSIARTPTSLLQPMGKSEAFLALLEHSMPPANRGLATDHFETMMDTAASCDCYRLQTGTDPDEAARQLAGLLDRDTRCLRPV